MDLRKIEGAVRAKGSDWQTMFRRHNRAWQCILFPSVALTETEYSTLSRRLAGPTLTQADRQRNNLRALASRSDGLA
jgi:hypothetical protein